MGDKPGKYWDYRECGWVNCPTPADEVVAPRALGHVVPAQDRPVEAESADATVVGTAQ